MLTSSRFWIGVGVGVGGAYAWRKYGSRIRTKK